ncbi:hypothetical protein BGX26_009454 [Mortierella sp. AD094]|nr:hypothetical protein BGX26_009454 [Mortierella sp. AD094]
MDAESYFNIEKDLGFQTERPRTNEEIVKEALREFKKTEQDDLDHETETDEETEDEGIVEPINSVQALEYLDKLSLFFQTTCIVKEEESRHHLKEIRKATEHIQNAIIASKKQTRITDYF